METRVQFPVAQSLLFTLFDHAGVLPSASATSSSRNARFDAVTRAPRLARRRGGWSFPSSKNILSKWIFSPDFASHRTGFQSFPGSCLPLIDFVELRDFTTMSRAQAAARIKSLHLVVVPGEPERPAPHEHAPQRVSSHSRGGGGVFQREEIFFRMAHGSLG